MRDTILYKVLSIFFENHFLSITLLLVIFFFVVSMNLFCYLFILEPNVISIGRIGSLSLVALN